MSFLRPAFRSVMIPRLIPRSEQSLLGVMPRWVQRAIIRSYIMEYAPYRYVYWRVRCSHCATHVQQMTAIHATKQRSVEKLRLSSLLQHIQIKVGNIGMIVIITLFVNSAAPQGTPISGKRMSVNIVTIPLQIRKGIPQKGISTYMFKRNLKKCDAVCKSNSPSSFFVFIILLKI